MIFANVTITPHTVERTRQHFIALCRQCIADAQGGRTRVNNLQSYVAWQEDCIARLEAGHSDHTFTFLQRALWLQTGECVPLFSR